MGTGTKTPTAIGTNMKNLCNRLEDLRSDLDSASWDILQITREIENVRGATSEALEEGLEGDSMFCALCGTLVYEAKIDRLGDMCPACIHGVLIPGAKMAARMRMECRV